MYLIIWNHPDTNGATLVPDDEMPRYRDEQDPQTHIVMEHHLDELDENEEAALTALKTFVNAIGPGWFWVTLQSIFRTSFDLGVLLHTRNSSATSN